MIDIPEIALYTLSKYEKKTFLLSFLLKLFKHHIDSSKDFCKMMAAVNYRVEEIKSLEDLPFVPVRLFKMFELLSVDKVLVVKTMTSSGTSNQVVSKIFLDKHTAQIQTKTLSKIVSSLIGKSRAPMIIIDCEATVKNRDFFSARAAGINGFSMFASKKIFALKEDMSINENEIIQFIENYKGETIVLFGFTFMVYKYFYEQLLLSGIDIDLSKGILIHGGGWKKLADEAIDNETFKLRLKNLCGISRVHDYYGMVEQTGSIHVECENGFLHTSEFSEIIVRSSKDFSVCDFGTEGIIQLISILPYSYPGQSLLTEDIGVIYGEDDCLCGRKGKYFKVTGRLKSAEIRGCSDTFRNV
jgi:phenylacetate-coenzyme A ligase PaaK-like adenylate-forming protein